MATYKYLDNTGLGQVWEKIKTLVSNSIPTPDWNESDSTSANYIANKPPIKTGTGTNSIIIGDSDNIASGICSIASGYQNISSNKYSIAFGETSKASGQDSVAIGAFLNLGTITLTGGASSLTYTDTATNQSTVDLLKRYGQSLFVWVNNKPIRLTSITSNENLLITFTFESTLSEEAITAVDYTLYAANIATGVGAMAFGHANRASGQNAFVFGTSNASTGTASFVEGKANEASNNQSHAEGFGTKSLGKQSHSQNRNTIAAGSYTHAQGEATIANGYAETTLGRYNVSSNGSAQTSYNTTNSPYILVAGNGTADNARSNAYTLDWFGNGWYAGKLTVGSNPVNTMDVATKGYVDTSVEGISPDWNENSSSSPNYIENRTHWREISGTVVAEEQTPTVDDYTYINYNNTFQAGDSVTVIYNGTIYSDMEAVNIGDFPTLINADENWKIVYDWDSSLMFFDFTELDTLPDVVTVSIINNATITYHKLDDNYLDGKLIKEGTGANSEIFNGTDYKEATGASSHVEGYAEQEGFLISLTGDANATQYTCSIYDGYNTYNTSYNNLASLMQLTDKNGHVLEQKVSSINITASDDRENPKTGTITLDKTLSQNSAISNSYYLIIPVVASRDGSHAEGYTTRSLGIGSHSEGSYTVASGSASHAEGNKTIAKNNSSHAEGYETLASGDYTHAEGHGTIASYTGSHAEGGVTKASNNYSHAEGYNTTASGQYSHAEGNNTTASNNYSHAEGYNTTANGYSAHAEGYYTTASHYAHAEGYYTTATGQQSHAEGKNTTAQRRSQHVFGEYNVLDTTGSGVSTKGSYIEIVGNGTGTSARSNARTLDWNGNEVLAGKLTVGTAPTNNMDVATKQYVDTATASITDEKLSTGTIGNNVYYPIVGDNTASATTKYIDSTGLKYDATSSTNGYARLYLGNGTASGTAGSKYGRLMIYGTTAYAVTLDSGSPTENRSISLPNKNGTVALTSDVPTKTSDLTNDSGFLTSHQSLSNYVALSGAQTISGVKTFDMEVKFNGGGGASDISTNVQCAFKVNRGQITNFFTQNIYTKTNDITFYKYSDIVNSAPLSPTALFTIKNGGTVSIGTTSNIPSITENNELTTKKYVDDAISGITGALSMTNNVITFTNANGTTSSVTIPTSGGGTGGASSLSELNDTTITSPSDGQILRYDNSSSKWINSNETTYTFDGTYNASTNKAATVSTVTNAIGALTIPTKTSDLTNDSGFMTGMTILAYGSSSWADFIDAYTNKRVVYCRASSNSNPASGSQTRLAFMAYVNDAENPTNVEFQYYRSVSSHSNNQQGDQVYVYKLDKSSGWSVTVRENYTKVVAGTGLTGNWASGAITLSLSSPIPVGSTATPQPLGTASAGSSSDFSKADHVHALPTLSISSNVITLTGASGQTTSVTLPVYNGGVSSS